MKGEDIEKVIGKNKEYKQNPIANKNKNNNKKNNSVVISEYPYYIKARKYTFPARNRIIAGICEALFIIEAKVKSGTLITSEFAYELRKRYICAAS